MNGEIISLGWAVRFVPVRMMDVVSRFYGETLGLPSVLRWRTDEGRRENKDYFWGGEAIIFDHNYGGVGDDPDPLEADPDTARQIEIFRVGDLEAVLTPLKSTGVEVSRIRPCDHGREAFVRDPMGMLLGLRERFATSPFAADREAERRRARGEGFNPGCSPMPNDWQEIGWIRIAAADPSVLTTFYRDRVGLRLIAEQANVTLFDLGDNTTLEIVGGGRLRPAPMSQMASSSAIILRVSRLAPLMHRLQSQNVHLVHDVISYEKGDFTYFADPEGNVMGIAERRHPGVYARAVGVSPEDLEASRRWAEVKATP